MSAQVKAEKPSRTFNDILSIVKNIGESTISQYASDADENARFPTEAFDALKAERLLSSYVPEHLGGDGLNISQICGICEEMANYDASTAMIYAMHQIQVACLVNHVQGAPYFEQYLLDLAKHQFVLASATTEIGVGGDVRTSICAVAVNDGRFELVKKAPVVSYALNSDAIMATCRRSDDAPGNDQVVVLIRKEDSELEQICGWDPLGFRATCSSGYVIKSNGKSEQILPVPYAEILAKSMHPVSHLTWGSLWTGLAASAVEIARKTVREAARKNPDTPPVSALRLSEVNELLFSMRSGLHEVIHEYQLLLDAGDDAAFENFGFAIKINNVKIRCSELLIEIVGKALQIVGISGYKNDSEKSLSRHLRDAYGASLMVNNDRIRGHNATMQIAYKGK